MLHCNNILTTDYVSTLISINNIALGGNGGGGIFSAGLLTANTCRIFDNTANGSGGAGGGFDCFTGNNATFQVTNQTTDGAYFHSPTNYQLLPTAEGVFGAGTSGSPTPATDFNGTARPALPTIGAYEGVTATPVATNASTNGQTGAIAFSGTGVSINATTNNGVITSQLYTIGSTGTPPTGIDRLSPYFWVVSTTGSSFSGSATFDWSGIPNNGVSNPATVRLLRRSGFGTTWGVVTTGGSGTSISVSGLTEFSEFALGGVGVDNPLPVELSSFTGAASTNGVRL